MVRLPELDVLKLFALVLLFAYHSSISVIYPDQMWFVQFYLLSAFFIVSGYLFANTLKHPVLEIASKKIRRIWIPLLLGLTAVLITGFVSGASIFAYIYHASLLSVFYLLQSGNLNLFHLWYLVHLIWYFIIFAFLYKAIKNDKIRASAVAILFVFLSYLWAIDSPFKPEWKFIFFLIIFYAGIILGEKNRLEKLYNLMDRKYVLIFLLVIAFASTMNTPSFAFENKIISEMVNMSIFILARNAFCISAVLVSLWAVRKIRYAKLSSIASFASCGLVFAYLIQPLVSGAVSCLFINNGYCSPDILPIWQALVMIPIAFALTIVLAHYIQRYYDKAWMWFLKRI